MILKKGDHMVSLFRFYSHWLSPWKGIVHDALVSREWNKWNKWNRISNQQSHHQHVKKSEWNKM